jgi:hypothetical protein
MALTLCRTPLEHSSTFGHLEDWQVLDDGKPVGRLYQLLTRQVMMRQASQQPEAGAVDAETEIRALLRAYENAIRNKNADAVVAGLVTLLGLSAVIPGGKRPL